MADDEINSSQTTSKKTSPMTAQEKAALRELVQKYKDVVESKKTDFGTTGKKQDAWNKIEAEFCSISGNSKRSTEQLKNTWKNMKQRAKSEISKHKRSMRITGGGPGPAPLSTETLNVASIIPDQMNPLNNPYDCDKDVPNMEFQFEDHDDDNLNMDHEFQPQKRKKTSDGTRTQKDARSSIVDMEAEEHKVRMDILRIEKLTAEATLVKVRAEHSGFMEESKLRIEILKFQLNAAQPQVPPQFHPCSCPECKDKDLVGGEEI